MFKKNLVDPIDKPATRKKTFDRILGFLTSTLFSEGSDVVANGCAISIIEIFEEVFPEML